LIILVLTELAPVSNYSRTILDPFSNRCAWRITSPCGPDGADHGLESKPLLAFAVCYVTAHLALDLVDEKQAEEILNYCEERLEE
jgi:hypothetical protein